MTAESFDIFLSHNSADKDAVRRLAAQLRADGLKVWLDEEQLVPGQQWLEAIEQTLENVRAAVILIGSEGLGPWEMPEMRVCLLECISRKLPVIPVLLPGAPEKPKIPAFLRLFTWVDLRKGLEPEGIARIKSGVMGVAPGVTLAPGGIVRHSPTSVSSSSEGNGKLVTEGLNMLFRLALRYVLRELEERTKANPQTGA